jgi:hypothetical protein
MSKQVESTAYHEAGHMTAAVVQGMPIRVTGLHVDLHGHGCADYFDREPGDPATNDVDQVERKRTIIALYAAHEAQRKFYPEVFVGSWLYDLSKIQMLIDEMGLDKQQAQAVRDDLNARAAMLVERFWALIEDLAKALLSKDRTMRLAEDTWGSGTEKQQMSGSEVVEFFARQGIPAQVVGDGDRNLDSTQIVPFYDSLH